MDEKSDLVAGDKGETPPSSRILNGQRNPMQGALESAFENIDVIVPYLNPVYRANSAKNVFHLVTLYQLIVCYIAYP